MVTAVASHLQDKLRDGSCLLASGPQSTVPAALVSGPKSTAAAAINKTALAAGTTSFKTGAGATAATAALGAGTLVGTILGILVIGAIAYGANVIVRAYID